MKDKKIVFMGTPDFAVPVLKMLIAKTNVIMVVTQPDKEVGRKKLIQYSPVKQIAIENNIPIFQPEKIRKDFSKLSDLEIDLIVTCAYGQIIPKEVLDLPKYGCINVHASLLPKYRGSAPIQWAILNGDTKTGITIMYMDEGMDTGDIIKSKEILISAEDNVGTLHDKLSVLGKDTLLEVLPDILNNKCKRIKQGNNYSLAPMIKREDEKINFNDMGVNIINKIRAFNPWPLANIVIDSKEIKVIDAEFKPSKVKSVSKVIEISSDKLGISCQDGVIYLKKIKPYGKNVMDIKSYLNGLNKETYLNKAVN